MLGDEENYQAQILHKACHLLNLHPIGRFILYLVEICHPVRAVSVQTSQQCTILVRYGHSIFLTVKMMRGLTGSIKFFFGVC